MMSKQHPERIFGEYTLKRKLGVGGMATVYYAVHNKLQREVAIKIIHEHFADDDIAIKRLEREAHITKKLKHPNIVPIITFNRVDNRPYLVMPFYAGKTLADYFYHPRAVTHDVTIKILQKLADALDYAHSKGVIHRDFKLENILLDKNHTPAISDFGIAQVANTTRLTATSNFLGTPQYLAPEQASSAYDEVDYRVDLYAFGVMAYLMLTGVFPFTAPDPIQLIMKHANQAVTAPTLVNTELPSAVDAVLIRALAKDPDFRYESAVNFVQSLDKALRNISPVTTIIDMQKPNPIEPTQNVPATRNFADGASSIAMPQDLTTRSLDASDTASNAIPAVQPTDADPQPKRRSRALVWLLLLFIVGGIGLFVLLGGDNPVNAFVVGNAEATEEANTLIVENTEEATRTDVTTTPIVTDEVTQTVSASNTARPSRTPRATNTERPTNTPSPTNTATATRTPSPTNTVRPSNTPIPPTNTPRPLPTNTPVPPTNVPVQPTNPPSNNNPVAPIVDPIVNTAVPDTGCVLIVGC